MFILAVPAWVWATLIMSAFIVLSALAIWLVRIPIDRTPGASLPSSDASENDERAQ
jgi:hypothetical protein